MCNRNNKECIKTDVKVDKRDHHGVGKAGGEMREQKEDKGARDIG